LEFELKEIRERSLAFWVLIAIFIHIAVGYAVYSALGSPHISDLPNVFKGKSTVEGVNPQGGEISPSIIENIGSDPAAEENPANVDNKTQTEPETTEFILPPIDTFELSKSGKTDSTFIHESSGLLFADEIPIPGQQKTVKKQLIVDPQINREFALSNLPRQYRDREWKLTLRLKVSKEGKPVGKIRVVKSSGDNVLDQLTISRVSESSFEPAHYEQSTAPIDHTFDLQIHYK
jgi:TonB family protein